MNYFELVGIDPNAQWDQTHFEQLLQKKRAEWSIQCTGVGRKALQAKQYLGLLPDIQTVMSDPVKRLAHLTDIRQEKIAEHEKQLQRDIGWYNAQKSATRNELDKFFDAYQDIATKDQIMVQLHIVIRPSNAGTTKIPFHIETSTLNEIDDMLNVLNKTSLYDLLHLPQTADEKTLCAAARRLYEEAVQSRSEAPEKILAKHAESIFFSLEKRTQYDEILKQKELDKLCKELDGVMGRKSDPVLLPSLIEGFLQRAYAAGCSQREAYDRLFKYAAQKEWTILPDSVDKEAQKRHNEELLRDMIEKKSYFSAQKLLHKYEEDMFDGKVWQSYHGKIHTAITKARREFSQAKTRLNLSSREEKILHCRAALRFCADYQEVQDSLSQLLAAPRNFQAYVDETVVVLSWELPMPDVQCRIIRKYFTPPESEADGQDLTTSAGQLYEDDSVEIGLPVYYAAFTVCEDVISFDAARLREPLLVKADVADVQIWTNSSRIELTWRAPSNLQNLIVRRKEGMIPQSIQEGSVIVPQDMEHLIDDHVQNNITYYYQIYCQFKNHKGHIETTPGIIISATPDVHPERINDPVEEVTNLTYQQWGPLLYLQWQWPTNCQAANVSYRKIYDLRSPAPDKMIVRRVTRKEYEYLGYYEMECALGQQYAIVVATILEQDGRRTVSSGVELFVNVEEWVDVDYEIKKNFYNKQRYLILRASTSVDLPAFRLVYYKHRLPLNKEEGELVFSSAETILLDGKLRIPLGQRTYPSDTFGKLFLEDEHAAHRVRFRLLDREKSRLG